MASELTYSLPELGAPNTAADPLIRTALSEIKTVYNSEVAAAPKPGKWYPPKINAGEGTRTNTELGPLNDAADELPGVVVPTNGLVVVTFAAQVKCSVTGAGSIGLYFGSNLIQ